MRTLIYFCLVLLIMSAWQTTTNATDSGQYIIVAPGNIHPERDYRIAVVVHNTTEPCRLKVGITGPSANLSETVELATADEVKLVTLKLPKLVQGDYNLTVVGLSGLIFENTTALNMDPTDSKVIIQTDKKKYKPGDTLKFRVIFLDENLKPTEPTGLHIWIQNEKNYRLKEIRNITTTSGVYTGEYVISEFAKPGYWELYVHSDQQISQKNSYFEVKEYVLPKYSISLEATPHVAVADGDMSVVVRANYTYGKPVSGQVVLEINLNNYHYYNFGSSETMDKSSSSIIRTAPMVNGKAKFDLNVREYENEFRDKTYSSYASITASVEEQFTGVKLKATGGTQLYPYRYEKRCVSYITCYTFKGNATETVEFMITYIDGTALNDTVSPVYLRFKEAYSVKYDSRDKADKLIRPVPHPEPYVFESRMNKLGVVSFERNLPKLTEHEHFDRYYAFELEYKDEKRSYGKSYQDYEPKVKEDPEPKVEEPKTFFRMKSNYGNDSHNFKLGAEASILLNSSSPLTYFNYYIIGRGNILDTGHVKLDAPNQTYTLKFKTSFAMLPSASIFVTYIDEKGDLQYAEGTIVLEEKLLNSLNITAPEEVKPGTDVTLSIRTKPKSFVGLLAIDQSVLLLGGGSSNYELSESSLIWSMSRYGSHAPWLSRYMNYPGAWSGLVTLTNANHMVNSNLMPSPIHNRISVMNDGLVHRTTPMFMPLSSVYASASPAHAEAQVGASGGGSMQKEIAVRKDFAETWIFDNIESTETEVFNWSKKIPDTITSWVVSGFSIHPEDGIGVTSEDTKIRTFLPFFVSVRLPYSVVRGELIRIPALVFNYLSKKLLVDVTLDNGDQEYDFMDTANEVVEDNERVQQVTVPAGESRGVEFLIRPKAIGNIRLKIKAISAVAGDIIEKTLKVVPEGVTQYVNRAVFVQLRDGDANERRESIELEFPPNYVADSQRIEVSTIGDLLGPVLKNVENLIRLPSGCGEQTMSKLVPNYFVLSYLKTSNKLTPDMEARIKRNLETGYQNMLNYKHEDGSFSSFGPRTFREDDPPRNGSTWLTAYVLQSLSQISTHITVDKNILDLGYKYLLSKQAPNGSFIENGEYFYTTQRSHLLLTAKVALAMIELGKQGEDPLEKALKYLVENFNESKELLPRAIAAYTLRMANHPAATEYLNKLRELAKTEAGRTWWSDEDHKTHLALHPRWYHYINSGSVESTSYVLLALLETEVPENVVSTIKWLIEQRNSYGGFATSQDTVMGLQALTKFVEKSGYRPATMHIEVSSRGGQESSHIIELGNDNGLLLNIAEFSKGTKVIDFIAKGNGTALVQISYQYNVLETEPKPSFKVTPTVNKDAPINALQMDVCVEYIEEDVPNSNMALLDITMPSGYTVEDTDGIKSVEHVRLIEKKNSDSALVIYFDSLPKGKSICVPIQAAKSFEVSNQKPAPIVLYDYYDPNKKSSEYYSVVGSS